MSPSVTPTRVGNALGNDQSFSTGTLDEINGTRNWGDDRIQNSDDYLRIGFWNCGGFPIQSNDGKNQMNTVEN